MTKGRLTRRCTGRAKSWCAGERQVVRPVRELSDLAFQLLPDRVSSPRFFAQRDRRCSARSDLNTNIDKRIDDLRAELVAARGDLVGRFDRFEGRLERVEAQQARLENVLVGKLTEVEARLARIESHLDLH